MGKKAIFMRNFVFGVEDSLVSTIGLLSGIAIADVPRATIFLTGVVLIFVEAFSMAVGSFLSEHSVEDMGTLMEQPGNQPVRGGIIMFFSYFIAGFIPLAPYRWMPTPLALKVSIALSLVALFILGLMSGELSRKSIWKNGIRMFLAGGMAIAVVGK